ncbi:MAG: MgtC/SapB family protein [Dehalococcoidia bacterium]
MSPLLETVLRFLLATALGAGIGYQRERAGKRAGIRTHILVGAGSALFTLASIYGFGAGVADTSRVAAGVVVGVGFIGGGVILRGAREEEVVGLTTAATIWVTAAIGLCAGAGMYLLSVVATGVILGVLMLARLRGHDRHE